MPIYMDRHDVSEMVTAEIVARLHQEDLKIQDQFGCRGLTYWFDDKRKTAFCLVEAPDAKAIQRMHDKAHGQVPHSIIEVNPEVVESFLGRITDPQKNQNTELNIIDEAAFRTILVIKIKRPNPGKKSSASLPLAMDNFKRATLGILAAADGKLVKQTDYYYLASCRSVSLAVQAARSISQSYRSVFTVARRHQDLKIALSAGVPVNGQSPLFGDAIRLAERMSEVISAEISVCSEVTELYAGENVNPLSQDGELLCLTPDEEKFLNRLMNYIGASWNNPGLKGEDLCRSMGCSKSQLYRRMVRLTNQAPNVFIREYRLKEALKLVNKKAGNISEIAFETGFSSPSYFSKCFQKKFGRFPSQYVA